ncbi:uncharacterized protein K444DRAFT_637688 [Hyaloscypha bicolor E]|uniref:Phytanoyl-CoA dioxygenase family protein n=1 Tax=Hyaloscypha bicolor E TaxID=1095630 RepID=A0A2J6SHP6_9HELO|nr:uncharacterized protein K444DRAFT_637688 [Hyaloscypha bicolor E]PMD50301.1 hypothetical protein K444DRAFT_637688 [Hyaloscypha bicolor E]
MAPRLGLGHDSASSFHASKGYSIPPTKTKEEIEMAKATLPKVLALDSKTCTVEEIVDAMKVTGGVIIRNAVSHDALDLIESHEKTFATSKPQIMNTVCFSINPGAHAQPLHRDDWCYQVVAQKADRYPDDLQRDTGIGWFVAGKDATFENGATRFIPGSHLWEHGREPDDNLVSYAELKRGDAFMMFASCYHGGGANTTKDQERLLFSCFMTRGWLRQEENQYISFTREETLAMDKDVQKIAGYQLSEPFLGWVKSTDPMVVLDPSAGVGNKDLFQKEDSFAKTAQPA